MEHRKHRKFIASSAAVSFVSLILVCVSLTSRHWIHARGAVVNDTIQNYRNSIIDYGLFEGTLIRSILESPKIYEIYLTCDWAVNLCAWSCLNDKKSRLEEVQALINGEKRPFSCQSLTTLFTNSVSKNNYSRGSNDTDAGRMLNAAMNLSAIIFVILTIISLLICGILGVLNYERCPKSEILNIPGIILSSVIAFIFNFTGLVLYGCYFDYWIAENIAILDTIVGDFKSYATLGSGYWLFMAGLLNPISILLMYIRHILLMRKERAETVIIVARVNDPTTVLY